MTAFPKTFNSYRSFLIRYYIIVAVETASWNKQKRNTCNYKHSSEVASKCYLPSASMLWVGMRNRDCLSARKQTNGRTLTEYGPDVHGSIPKRMSRPDQLWGPTHSRVQWVPWGILFSRGSWIPDLLTTPSNCIDFSALNGKIVLHDLIGNDMEGRSCALF
jgi:hypothetical protein